MSRTKSTFRKPVTAQDRVLVISDRDDVHARAVLSKLEAVSGMEEPGVLFDTATFPMASDISLATGRSNTLMVYPALPEMYGSATPSVLRQAGPALKKPLQLERLLSVYWRRPRPPLIDDVLVDLDLRHYAAKSSRATIDGLVEQLALSHRVVDRPSTVARASLKVLQLELARRVGLDTPRTLVTNSPADARAFINMVRRSGAELISKSPSDLHYFPAKTEVVDDRKTALIERIRLSPAILQERIVGGADLRITVVGDRLFGMAQTSEPGFDGVDSRIDPAPQRESFDPPALLLRRILALQRLLGLSFAAYDFKRDQAGTPYFLEVNPSGQWLAVELSVQHPIAEALALYLWHGPGAEWRTRLPPLREEDLSALYPFSMHEEYEGLMRMVEGKERRPTRVATAQ